MRGIMIFIILFLMTLQANDSYCSSINSYATSVAYVVVKNLNMVSPKNIDYEKTKTVLLSSQKIGDDLNKEIHHITFYKKDGKKVEVITVNDTSSEECSMSGVDVYLIDKKISDDYRPKSLYRIDERK